MGSRRWASRDLSLAAPRTWLAGHDRLVPINDRGAAQASWAPALDGLFAPARPRRRRSWTNTRGHPGRIPRCGSGTVGRNLARPSSGTKMKIQARTRTTPQLPFSFECLLGRGLLFYGFLD